MDTKYKLLAAFFLLCWGGVQYAQNYRITENDNRLKAIEKVLKGDKHLCSVRRKILNTHINCDQLKNEQEQDNATN